MSTRSSLIPVSQAAKELGVSRQRVLQRLNDGSLVGEKLGSQWLILRESLGPAARTRPLSDRMGWALVSALSGQQPKSLRPSESARLKERIDRLQSHDPASSAGLLASWLRARAQKIVLEAHPEDLAELRQDERLVLTGISDPRAGLASASELDAYISRAEVRSFADDHFLEMDGPVEAPNITLRLVTEDLWPKLQETSRQEGPDPRVAPVALSIVDLVERGNSREVRAAHEMMEHLWRR